MTSFYSFQEMLTMFVKKTKCQGKVRDASYHEKFIIFLTFHSRHSTPYTYLNNCSCPFTIGKMFTADKPTLFFIPLPVFSHLVAAVKAAELLAQRDNRFQITVLVMKLPIDTKISSYINNKSSVNFIELPLNETFNSEEWKKPNPGLVLQFIEGQKPVVRDAVAGAFHGRSSNIPAGFVIDMFCVTMMDVADEFGAPTYVYFTCSAATLGLMLHVQSLKDDFNEDDSKFVNPGEFVTVPGYKNPFPTSAMPDLIVEKEIRNNFFFDMARRFRRTKGILVNSFLELEAPAIRAFSEVAKWPPIYPVGPVLQDFGEKNQQDYKEIIDWLDEQPDSSVVFLCFGSMGAFDEDQVKEIAAGIERSGHRFLWSLRKPPPNGERGLPSEYENFSEILPEGFLNGRGKVIGWAPQVAVLAHRAIGGFVSHCGWNSTLESVWFGVPVAVWPLAAEQQANAFQLVKELEMAVEIKIDYRKGSSGNIPAEKIESAIGELMDLNNPIRLKVGKLKEKSRRSLLEDESSSKFLVQFADDFLGIMQSR